MTTDCPACRNHACAPLFDAVARDDIDRAIALGLLAFTPPASSCAHCADAIARTLAARDTRLRALAARERFRARETRLAERAEARARKRAAATPPTAAAGTPTPPALPPAAAAALARAKAKAAAKPQE